MEDTWTKKGLLNKYIRYDSLLNSHAVSWYGDTWHSVYGCRTQPRIQTVTIFCQSVVLELIIILFQEMMTCLSIPMPTRSNTAIEFRPVAHTRSVPASGLTEWIIQKKRHLTTAPYYRLRDKIILSH